MFGIKKIYKIISILGKEYLMIIKVNKKSKVISSRCRILSATKLKDRRKVK